MVHVAVLTPAMLPSREAGPDIRMPWTGATHVDASFGRTAK